MLSRTSPDCYLVFRKGRYGVGVTVQVPLVWIAITPGRSASNTSLNASELPNSWVSSETVNTRPENLSSASRGTKSTVTFETSSDQNKTVGPVPDWGPET